MFFEERMLNEIDNHKYYLQYQRIRFNGQITRFIQRLQALIAVAPLIIEEEGHVYDPTVSLCPAPVVVTIVIVICR